jgi:hypothetical protein
LQVRPTLLNDQSYLRFLVEEHVLTSSLPPSLGASRSRRAGLLSDSHESLDHLVNAMPQLQSRASSRVLLLRKSAKTDRKSDVTVFRWVGLGSLTEGKVTTKWAKRSDGQRPLKAI